ncbi:DNA polymerase III subunit gamma/tau [bacterium]|nr:MAG: DNA polymerase III subunit gamma/tau [bacterium]
MSTIYNKHRPKIFDDLLGQDHITQVLKAQIKQKDFSHAYIFEGPRGCGKTSAARIFAKAVNCLTPKNGEPCLKCDICKSYEEGSFVDIVEFDAASRRKIEDVEGFKDMVNYKPAISEYKVYIIDEVHMLTDTSFNALLKTIEEPPEYVIFILCTTDVQKVPVTIQSRCQQFHFRLAGDTELEKKLKKVLQNEKLDIEEKALQLVIRAANGSFRDAESILQKLITTSDISDDKKITYDEVIFKLGLPNEDSMLSILIKLQEADFDSVISSKEEVLKTISVENMVVSLINFLKFNSIFDIETRFKVLELFLELRSKMKSSQNSSDWFDVYLWKVFKITNSTKDKPNLNSFSGTDITQKEMSNDVSSGELGNNALEEIQDIKNTTNKDNAASNVDVSHNNVTIIMDEVKTKLVSGLKETDSRLSEYLTGAVIKEYAQGTLTIAVKSKYIKSVLEIKRNFDKIQDIVSEYITDFGKLNVIVDKSIENTDEVIDIKEIFGEVIA